MSRFISTKNAVMGTGINYYMNTGIGAKSPALRSNLAKRAYFCCPNPVRNDNNFSNGNDANNDKQGQSGDNTDIAITSETGEPTSETIELQIWYSSDDTSFLKPGSISDDGNIQQWEDKSSYGHNLNGSGNTKPLFQTDPSLNNLSIIELIDTSYFSINPIAWFNDLSSFTFFILFKTTQPTTLQTLSTTNNNILNIQVNNDSTINIAFGNVSGTVNDVLLDDNWHLVTMIYDGGQTINEDKLKFRFDKTLKTISYSDTIAETTGSNNTELNIGSGSNSFIGFLAEILVYDVALSNANLDNIESYITDKWGV